MTTTNYRLLAYGRQVGIGVAGASYVTLSAVAKTNCSAAPYCVPNELICGELGRTLRLPVPPLGVIIRPGDSPLIASLDFNLTGNSLLDVINTDAHLSKWIDRVQGVPDYFIEEVCQDAQPYGLTAADVTAAISFLKQRRDRLLDIMKTHHAEFTAIKSWSLLP